MYCGTTQTCRWLNYTIGMQGQLCSRTRHAHCADKWRTPGDLPRTRLYDRLEMLAKDLSGVLVDQEEETIANNDVQGDKVSSFSIFWPVVSAVLLILLITFSLAFMEPVPLPVWFLIFITAMAGVMIGLGTWFEQTLDSWPIIRRYLDLERLKKEGENSETDDDKKEGNARELAKNHDWIDFSDIVFTK